MSTYISLDKWKQFTQWRQEEIKWKKLLYITDYYDEHPLDVIVACNSIFGRDLFTQCLQIYLNQYSIKHALQMSIRKCIQIKRREK